MKKLKPYNHNEVTRLLDKLEICANNIRNNNVKFQQKLAISMLNEEDWGLYI